MYRIVVCFLLGSTCFLYGSEHRSQYTPLGPITSVAQMRVLATVESSECNKKRLQEGLISPRTMALCYRHFLGIDECVEVDDVQHFMTMHMYAPEKYVAVGLKMLEFLCNEGEAQEDDLWALKSTIGQMNVHEKDITQDLKCYKKTYEQLRLGTFMSVGMSAMLALAGGMGIIARFFC